MRVTNLTMLVTVWHLIFALALVSAGCSGDALPQNLSVEYDWFEFGQVAEGESLNRSIAVENTGDFDLTFSAHPSLVTQSATDTAFEIQAPIDVIGPQESVEMYLTYNHSPERISYGYIEFLTNDPDEPEQMVVITGESLVPLMKVAIDPPLVDFGYLASGSNANQDIEIRNEGTADIEWFSAEISVGTDEFYVVSAPSDLIPPGEARTITVGFAPEDGSHETAALNVDAGAGQITLSYVATLSGNTPGSAGNTAPSVTITSPTDLLVLSEIEDLTVVADVIDGDQPDSALYCTLESTQMGAVEQDVTDPATDELTMLVDVYNEDLGELQMIDYPGLHTLTLCCFDEISAYDCDTMVTSVLEEYSVDDADGDGYDTAQGDCDDTNPGIYPGALEQVDGVDEDCDGNPDNGTEAWDDDGDGYSEDDGDCNDDDPAIGPDATETANFTDDDCDGVIDEGTNNADDDGDGVTETTGDCDDTNADVYANAPELCDNLDNDCDGSADEDCFEDTPPLDIIGGIHADRVVVARTGVVELQVIVIANDGADLRYAWQSDSGSFSADSGDPTTSSTVTWTAPDEPGATMLWVEITDQASTDDEGLPLTDEAYLGIEVSSNDPTATTSQRGSGCVMGATGAPSWLALAALAALMAGLGARRFR